MLTDDALYEAYLWNESTRVERSNASDCVDICRVEFVCNMMTSSDERYEECVDFYSE